MSFSSSCRKNLMISSTPGTYNILNCWSQFSLDFQWFLHIFYTLCVRKSKMNPKYLNRSKYRWARMPWENCGNKIFHIYSQWGKQIPQNIPYSTNWKWRFELVNIFTNNIVTHFWTHFWNISSYCRLFLIPTSPSLRKSKKQSIRHLWLWGQCSKYVHVFPFTSMSNCLEVRDHLSAENGEKTGIHKAGFHSFFKFYCLIQDLVQLL